MSNYVKCQMENGSYCPLLTAHFSLLYILMQQFDLVPLIAELNAQQVAHRKHPYPLLAIDYRQMARADFFHTLQGLLRSLVTTNHRPQRAGYIAELQSRRIVPGHNDPV